MHVNQCSIDTGYHLTTCRIQDVWSGCLKVTLLAKRHPIQCFNGSLDRDLSGSPGGFPAAWLSIEVDESLDLVRQGGHRPIRQGVTSRLLQDTPQ